MFAKIKTTFLTLGWALFCLPSVVGASTFEDYCLIESLPLSQEHTVLQTLATLGIAPRRDEASCAKAQSLLEERNSLDLSYRSISDLSPLESLVHLQVLNLTGNQITSLDPLWGFDALYSVSLADNLIEEIVAAASWSNIRDINFDGNKIENLEPLSSHVTLKTLSVRNNQVRDVQALGSLRNLVKLALDKNQIFDIASLARLTELRTLSVGGNKITSFEPLLPLEEGHYDYTGKWVKLDILGKQAQPEVVPPVVCPSPLPVCPPPAPPCLPPSHGVCPESGGTPISVPCSGPVRPCLPFRKRGH